jgi:hypothetical protein
MVMKERREKEEKDWVGLGWVAFDSTQDMIGSKTKTKHGKQKKDFPFPKQVETKITVFLHTQYR